jgi:V8-like Glu-specific endopeptidase
MIKKTLALLILLLGCAGPAAAAQLDDAVVAARRGEYPSALSALSALAEKGDARAQFDVGFMHAYGWGVPRNSTEAIGWYRKAADQGLAVAQHFLGLAYWFGEGVEGDNAEASRWFARAAAQGFPQSQYRLGMASVDGLGVAKDPVRGYAWLILAGQGGVLPAPRLAQQLALDEAQRAQAKEIIERFKPKPESTLAAAANPRPEELLGLDGHTGAVADPSSFPASAIGVVAVAHFSNAGACSGTLVAPRIVLTAAHCLSNGTAPVSPRDVHFLAGMNQGTPASSAAAERFVVAKDYVPSATGLSTADRTPADWALIILKEAVPSRPVAVKALTGEELKAATRAGTISQIGYGRERLYSPSMLRNCAAGLGRYNGLLLVRGCLANFGYSGSPILVDIGGVPTVVGILSAMSEETRLTLVASASQFEAAIRDEIGAAAGGN